MAIIHVNFTNVKDEINEFVGQDLGNYGNGGDSSSIRHTQFINFYINNRSDHSK